MSNLTYSSLLSKSANPGLLENVVDSDLIGLHIFCKSQHTSENNLLRTNSQKWLPIIEGEIVFRKEVIVKSQEDDLKKSKEVDLDEEESEEEESEESEKEEPKD